METPRMPLPGIGPQIEQQKPVIGVLLMLDRNVKVTYKEGEKIVNVVGNLESVGPFLTLRVAGGTLISLLTTVIISVAESKLQDPAIGNPGSVALQ